jgi:hypothetical protein
LLVVGDWLLVDSSNQSPTARHPSTSFAERRLVHAIPVVPSHLCRSKAAPTVAIFEIADFRGYGRFFACARVNNV